MRGDIRALTELIERMNEHQQRLYACECAERVLGLFEEQFPVDDRPRRSVDTARRYANGMATFGEMDAAAEAAYDAAKEAADAGAMRAYAAAFAAVLSARLPAAKDAALTAAFGASAAVGQTHPVVHDWNAEREAEYQWQEKRAIQMLESLDSG